MNSFFVALFINLSKFSDIFEYYVDNHQVNNVRDMINNKSSVQIEFASVEKAYRRKEDSKTRIKPEIIKQVELYGIYKDIYTPAVVNNIKTYVVFRFEELTKADEFVIAEKTKLNCYIEEISPYFKDMNKESISKLISANKYIHSDEFTSTVNSIRSDTIKVDALYGTFIIGYDCKVILTCKYRCIMLETVSDLKVYDVLRNAWNNYTKERKDIEYTDNVVKLNDSDKAAYIMLNDSLMETLLSDKDFVRQIMNA